MADATITELREQIMDNATFFNPLQHDLKIVVGFTLNKEVDDEDEYYADLVREDSTKSPWYVVVDGGFAKTLAGAYMELLIATAHKIERLRMDSKCERMRIHESLVYQAWIWEG